MHQLLPDLSTCITPSISAPKGVAAAGAGVLNICDVLSASPLSPPPVYTLSLSHLT